MTLSMRGLGSLLALILLQTGAEAQFVSASGAGGGANTQATFTSVTSSVYRPLPFASYSTAPVSSIFYANMGMGGSTSESSPLYSGLRITDTLASVSNLIGFQSLLSLQAGFSGSRIALDGQLNLTAAPSSPGGFYVAVQGDAASSQSVGGSPGAERGSINGAEFSAFLSGSGATSWNNVFGIEVSAGIASGASAGSKVLLSLEQFGGDAQRGTYFDGGIAFSYGDSAAVPGFGYGIAFGTTVHNWPFASDSVLIGAVPRTQASSLSTNMLADRSIDLSKVWNTTAAMILPGLVVDPSGQITINNLAIARTVGGMSIDLNAVRVVSAAPSAAGSAYSANDIVYEITSRSMLQVASVNGSGGILSLSVLVPGTLSNAPGGALSLTGGKGTGATVTLTTQALNTLSLNPSGGAVAVGGALSAASYSAGATAGVSCAAGTVSLATLVVTNGIVTHC